MSHTEHVCIHYTKICMIFVYTICTSIYKYIYTYNIYKLRLCIYMRNVLTNC